MLNEWEEEHPDIPSLWLRAWMCSETSLKFHSVDSVTYYKLLYCLSDLWLFKYVIHY